MIILQRKSQALWIKGDKQGAVKILVAAIKKAPSQLDNYLELAAYLNALHDVTQAEKLLRSALARFPHNQDIHYSLGTTYYAAASYSRALNEFKKITLPRLQNDKLYMLASTYYAQKDYGHALAFAVTAQQRQPKQVDVNLLAGDCFLAIGDFSHAETYYRQALDQAPASAPVNFKLGLTAMAQGKSNAAYFKQAKKQDAAYFAREKHKLTDIERYLKAQQK